MAELMKDFRENENPEIVRNFKGEREAFEFFRLLKEFDYFLAVQFWQFWDFYRYNGRVPCWR